MSVRRFTRKSRKNKRLEIDGDLLLSEMVRKFEIGEKVSLRVKS